MEIGNVAEWIQAAAAVVGFAFGGYQFRKAKQYERAKLIKDLFNGFYSDKEIACAYYKIEDDVTMTNETPLTWSRERDRLFIYLDTACYMYDSKILIDEEIEFFDYEIKIIAKRLADSTDYGCFNFTKLYPSLSKRIKMIYK